MSQQSSVKRVLMSAAPWELTQGPAWADLCDRWSTERESSLGSPGETREWLESLPFSPVVWSALILPALFTFFLRFASSAFCKSFILTACWVHAVGIRLLGPLESCARLGNLSSRSSWGSRPCFLCGIVGKGDLSAAAATIHLIVSKGTETITWDFCAHF